MSTPSDRVAANPQEFVDVELIAAAEAFIDIAEPVGNRYVVGKRLLFWQARERLKKAVEAMREALDD